MHKTWDASIKKWKDEISLGKMLTARPDYISTQNRGIECFDIFPDRKTYRNRYDESDIWIGWAVVDPSVDLFGALSCFQLKDGTVEHYVINWKYQLIQLVISMIKNLI